MSLDPTIMGSKLSNSQIIVIVVEAECGRTLRVMGIDIILVSIDTTFGIWPIINGCHHLKQFASTNIRLPPFVVAIIQ